MQFLLINILQNFTRSALDSLYQFSYASCFSTTKWRSILLLFLGCQSNEAERGSGAEKRRNKNLRSCDFAKSYSLFLRFSGPLPRSASVDWLPYAELFVGNLAAMSVLRTTRYNLAQSRKVYLYDVKNLQRREWQSHFTDK